MNFSIWRAGPLLCLAASGATAAAQPAAAPPLPSWVQSLPPRLPEAMHRTMQAYRDFITSSATTDWRLAAPMFDWPIGSPEQNALLQHMAGGSRGNFCVSVINIHMTGMLMRGGIAEARYRYVYGAGAAPAAAIDVAPVATGASFAWVDFGRESHPSLLYAFALCLAQRETGGVHAVLMTDFGSAAERDAYQALSRRFGSCLEAGEVVHANPLTLRPWLAEAQYQLFRSRQPDRAN